MKSGHGEFKWKASGNKYFGTWKNDKMDQSGFFTWGNGDVFINSHVGNPQEMEFILLKSEWLNIAIIPMIYYWAKRVFF